MAHEIICLQPIEYSSTIAVLKSAAYMIVGLIRTETVVGKMHDVGK